MFKILPIKPPNFTWVIAEKICALGFPGDPGNLVYLQQNGVTHLISLTAEKEPPYEHVKNMRYTNFKVVDFTPPSILQIERCLEIIQEENDSQGAVAIHCAKGYGRTGTVLACYFVKFLGQSGEQAIENIRKCRPGSIETEDQENRVLEYEISHKNKMLIS